jgi:hypothetical protein
MMYGFGIGPSKNPRPEFQQGCPTGFVADPVTGTCVPIPPPPPASTPWYKSPWTWVGIGSGGVVLAGIIYLVTRKG